MQNRQTSDVLCFDRARLHQSLIPLYQFNLKGVRGPSVSIHNMLIRENNLSTLTPDYQCKSKNDKVEITSQNHGFEVTKKNLPSKIEITHKSLFDNSIEGIKLKNKPVFSVQYHPESNPGPQDSHYLFNQFINEVKKNAKKKRY